MLALLDELESTKRDSARWFKAFEKAVSVGARYEERIAELEARTVSVKLPDGYKPHVQKGGTQSTSYRAVMSGKGPWIHRDMLIEACAAAGINLTVEG